MPISLRRSFLLGVAGASVLVALRADARDLHHHHHDEHDGASGPTCPPATATPLRLELVDVRIDGVVAPSDARVVSLRPDPGGDLTWIDGATEETFHAE